MDKEKLFGYTIEQWAKAALDFMDGDSQDDIRYKTGLGDERCKELMEMYNSASNENWFTLLARS